MVKVIAKKDVVACDRFFDGVAVTAAAAVVFAVAASDTTNIITVSKFSLISTVLLFRSSSIGNWCTGLSLFVSLLFIFVLLFLLAVAVDIPLFQPEIELYAVPIISMLRMLKVRCGLGGIAGKTCMRFAGRVTIGLE